MNFKKYGENIIVTLLEQAIDLHNSEPTHYCSEIGKISEKIAEIMEETNECDQILSIARNFTDGWGDSCNHEWRYYEGIQQGDWPVLAVEITEYIKSTNEVTNKKLLNFLLHS